MDRHMTWYLQTHYEDRRRGEVRERHYHDSGEVWVVINGDRSLVCRFDPDQLEAARAAVSQAGFEELADISAPPGDLAVMTYRWNIAGGAGTWVDAAYPRVIPDSVDALEEVLLRLEEEARE
jgi:hypothetical protein